MDAQSIIVSWKYHPGVGLGNRSALLFLEPLSYKAHTPMSERITSGNQVGCCGQVNVATAASKRIRRYLILKNFGLVKTFPSNYGSATI